MSAHYIILFNYIENEAGAFLSARDKGIEQGFNHAQKEIKDLIAKVGKVKKLKEIPLFKNCIDRLTIFYDLKK